MIGRWLPWYAESVYAEPVYDSLRIDGTADAAATSEATASCYAHKAIGCNDDGAECERATQHIASCAVPFIDAGASSKEAAEAHREMNTAVVQMQSIFQHRLQTHAVKLLRTSLRFEAYKKKGFAPKTMAAYLVTLNPAVPPCGGCQGAAQLEPGVFAAPILPRASTLTTMVCGENVRASLEVVADIETFLKCNGFLAPSGISGVPREYLARALRSFQFMVGVAMTGDTDAATISAMRQYTSGAPPRPVTATPSQDFTCTMNKDAKIGTVTEQQVWLQCNGFLVNGGVSGESSSEFAVAVQQFQHAACLSVDGKVGAQTAAAMKTYSPSKLPASQTQHLKSRPFFFQNGAKSGSEMCSGPSTLGLGAGAKTRLHTPKAVTYHEQPQYSRCIQNKEFTPHCVCRPPAKPSLDRTLNHQQTLTHRPLPRASQIQRPVKSQMFAPRPLSFFKMRNLDLRCVLAPAPRAWVLGPKHVSTRPRL